MGQSTNIPKFSVFFKYFLYVLLHQLLAYAWVYGCETWTIKKVEFPKIHAFKLWCWRTLESCLGYKEIKPVNPIGNQPWIFTGRTDAEAEAPILGHLMRRADSLEKTLMLGKIEGRGKWTEHEMAGWHHRLTGHEFAQTPGDSEGQGSLVCCSPWSRKDTT